MIGKGKVWGFRMTSITFYGGINEIGGNKILVKDRDTSIFLDFGMSFKKMGKYFEEFIQPRTCNGLGDLIELGIIPDIECLYRNDLLKNEGRKMTKKPCVDGVLFSHAHADHSWHASLLHHEIPLYCTPETKCIFQAAQESGRAKYYSEVFCLKENFVNRSKKPETTRKFNLIESGKRFKIGSIEVLPVAVDHSVPGAVGYILFCSDAIIAYTGDIRLHGKNNAWTKDFVQKAADAKPDALIIEGTRIKEGMRWNSEMQVLKDVGDFVKKTPKLAVCAFPPRDLDRLDSFYRVALANNRRLAISSKQMYLLELMKQQTKLKLPSLKDFDIYMERCSWGQFADRDYDNWERKYLNYPNMVKYEDISKKQERYLFYCDFYSIKELIDLKPKQGSNYIYSLSEPFNEEMELDFERLKNWLTHFKLPLLQSHASGHCSREELKEVIGRINPKKVFPIHTEQPLEFKEIAKGVEIKGVGEEVKV